MSYSSGVVYKSYKIDDMDIPGCSRSNGLRCGREHTC